MLTTVAWSQSVDPAGAFVQLNAVADQHVRVSGADIQCPALAHCTEFCDSQPIQQPAAACLAGSSVVIDSWCELPHTE